MGRGHGRFTLVPAKGADFSVQFEVLEGVYHADGFINGASQREVVDELVADDAVLVNQEEAAVGDQFPVDFHVAVFVNFLVSGQNAVVGGNGLVDVGNDGVAHALDAALVTGGVHPGPVGEFAVRGAAYDGYVTLVEFAQGFLEADQFSGAHKREVLRVEEQDHVLFAFELVKTEIRYDGTVYNCVCTEMRCRFSYEEHGRFFGLVLKE